MSTVTATPIDWANHLVNKRWAGKVLPIDPFAVACAEGLTLVQSMEESGWYDRANRRIEYNPAEVRIRQRFCVTHALGHHLMGHDPCPREGASTFSLYTLDAQEATANQFAGHLLVPSVVLKHLVIDKGWVSTERLEAVFDVSTVLLRHRLQQCRLLPS